MIRLVFLVNSLRRCGPINQIKYIINNLDQDLFTIKIVTLFSEKENSMIDIFEKSKISLVRLNYRNYFDLFLNSKRIYNILNNNFDILHSTGLISDIFAQSKKLKIPSLISVRNYPFEDYPSKFGFLLGAILSFIHISILKKTYNIACSKYIKDRLNIHNIKSIVINNGIQVDLSNTYKKQSIKKKIIFPKDKIIFLGIGSLIPRKNFSTILKAFNLITKNNYQLIILGDGRELSKLQKISNKNVFFMGNVNNVKDYIQESDYFISASFSEGLPNSLLEAASNNLKCIVSNIRPHRELSFKEELLFFDTFDHYSLAKLIEDLLIKKTNTYKINTRKIIINEYSAKNMSNKYQTIYKKLYKAKNG